MDYIKTRKRVSNNKSIVYIPEDPLLISENVSKRLIILPAESDNDFNFNLMKVSAVT